MTDNMHNYENSSYTRSKVEKELLAALLAENSVYPWDSSTSEAEAYFMEAEQEFGADWREEEMSARSHHFLSQLDQLWLAATPTTVHSSLLANLRAQFSAHIPQNWLDAIAHQARQALETQKSLSSQLVQCVQELLPNCLEADLQVLARPYAYAMRGSSNESQLLGNMTPEKWATLSEIQQAKVSMAIARYALEQLQADEEV